VDDMNKFVLILPIFLILLFGSAFALDNSQVDAACFVGGCQTLTLTPQQVQSMWDNFLYKALKPEKILPGKAALTNSGELTPEECKAGPELNMITKDNKMGQNVPLGCQTLEADNKNPFFNETCVGDYAVGMLIDTTIRMARCQGNIAANKNDLCSVFDKSLSYSNSETGISLVKKSLVGIFDANSLTSDFSKKEVIPTGEFLKKTTDAPVDPNAKIDKSTWDTMKSLVGDSKETADVATREPQKTQITNHIDTKSFVVNFLQIL
jgi:hypothetical protein